MSPTPRFPDALCALQQWILWRGIPDPKARFRIKKVPINARTLRNASSTTPKTWADYAYCVAALPAALEEWETDEATQFLGGGLGFVFTPNDPYFGLDLDGVRDPATGQLTPWAAQMITTFATYTEISPSGTGVHLLGHGTVGEHGKNRKPLEIYDRGRYFTMTGQALHTPARPLADCTTPLGWLLNGLEILPKALQRSGERLSQLFAGQWERTGDAKGVPYESASNADLAFCSLLRQAGASHEQCDALIRLSGLYRAKWDERHGARTYGEMTLAQAFGGTAPRTNGTRPPPQEPPAPETPTDGLQYSTTGKVLDTIRNLLTILRTRKPWKGTLWLDSVRNRPMRDHEPLTPHDAMALADWLGATYDMRCRNPKLLSACLDTVCAEDPRDLLQAHLQQLPAWDRIPRLHDWLHVVAGATPGPYCTAVSRLLPLALVARALDPGSICRYVVILEGLEESRKSTLLHDLVGEEWYIETSGTLEGKEPHILIQGAWLCELSELDSLTRTEENRLKSFLTMRKDSYVPKYSNTRVDLPRRTVFVGTTNEEAYLKGQTGNTRFFPIKVGQIHLPVLHDMRQQLFAEAVHVYQADPAQWWVIDEEALEAVKAEREHRRVTSVYEEKMSVWLAHQSRTCWEEIARDFLKLEALEKWKDRALQMEIAKALKALGWTRGPLESDEGRRQRYWYAPHVSPGRVNNLHNL